MFNRKYKIPIASDNYLNIYDKCDIGCFFCKFNRCVNQVSLNVINYDDYVNQKVLVSYSTDPYPYIYRNEVVPEVIGRLHKNNCSVVFLTRRAECLIKDLKIFNQGDYVGLSISENNDKNSTIENNTLLFQLAKNAGIKTWISLEPVVTFSFVREMLDIYQDKVDFIRIGKNDLEINCNWKNICEQVKKLNFDNVFIKE